MTFEEAAKQIGPYSPEGLVAYVDHLRDSLEKMDRDGPDGVQERKLKETLLQLTEVSAHRDRLRDMLNDIRGRAYQDALSGEQSKFFSALVLKIVEDGYTEKPKCPCGATITPDHSCGYSAGVNNAWRDS